MKDKTNLLFIHKLFKAFADSIINIFIPLYILKVTNNLTLSFLFLAISGATTFITILLFRKFIQKYGLISIIIHSIPIIIAQFLLNFYDVNILNCIICGVLMGLSQTFFSVPLNTLFILSDKKTNVAKFQIATNVGKLIFVLFSGFILSNNAKNSFLFLSILASIFYIISVIPILYGYNLLKNNYEKYKVLEDNDDINKMTFKHNYAYFNIFHITFSAFQSTIEKIIPLFLYVNNLSFKSVTIVIALIELFRIMANYLANYLVKKDKYLISVICSFIIFMTCTILIFIIKSPVVLYILSCIISLAFPLTYVPMFKIYCKKIKNDVNIFDGMTDRDAYIFTGKGLLFVPYFIIPTPFTSITIGILSSIIMFTAECKIIKNKDRFTKNEEIY